MPSANTLIHIQCYHEKQPCQHAQSKSSQDKSVLWLKWSTHDLNSVQFKGRNEIKQTAFARLHHLKTSIYYLFFSNYHPALDIEDLKYDKVL